MELPYFTWPLSYFEHKVCFQVFILLLSEKHLYACEVSILLNSVHILIFFP